MGIFTHFHAKEAAIERALPRNHPFEGLFQFFDTLQQVLQATVFNLFPLNLEERPGEPLRTLFNFSFLEQECFVGVVNFANHRDI